MGRRGYPKYESVSEKRAKALKALAKLRKAKPDISPVTIEGRTLVKSWWGKAWNQNLESYADYSNRIARGKSYVRNNAVLDLKMSQGHVTALVKGSGASLYQVQVKIDVLNEKSWSHVIKLCNHSISSLEELVAGQFPKELDVLFTEKKDGLFPSPEEIHFDCSCPDYAYMCKHVAATLYGIGTRLDHDPLLFFELRGVDGQSLIKKTVDSKFNSLMDHAQVKSDREIDEDEVSDLFGLS